jgi:hypothetical protein
MLGDLCLDPEQTSGPGDGNSLAMPTLCPPWRHVKSLNTTVPWGGLSLSPFTVGDGVQ